MTTPPVVARCGPGYPARGRRVSASPVAVASSGSCEAGRQSRRRSRRFGRRSRALTPPHRPSAHAVHAAGTPTSRSTRTEGLGAPRQAGQPKPRPRPKAAPIPKLAVVRPAWKPGPTAPRYRLAALLVVLVLLFIVVGVRLVDVQAMSSEHYAALGADQRLRSVELAGRTGFDLRPQRQRPRDLGPAADRLGQPAGGHRPRRLRGAARPAARRRPGRARDPARRRRDQGFVYVARKVDDATAIQVAGAGAGRGRLRRAESKRFYPDGASRHR